MNEFKLHKENKDKIHQAILGSTVLRRVWCSGNSHPSIFFIPWSIKITRHKFDHIYVSYYCMIETWRCQIAWGITVILSAPQQLTTVHWPTHSFGELMALLDFPVRGVYSDASGWKKFLLKICSLPHLPEKKLDWRCRLLSSEKIKDLEVLDCSHPRPPKSAMGRICNAEIELQNLQLGTKTATTCKLEYLSVKGPLPFLLIESQTFTIWS